MNFTMQLSSIISMKYKLKVSSIESPVMCALPQVGPSRFDRGALACQGVVMSPYGGTMKTRVGRRKGRMTTNTNPDISWMSLVG
mmetsp:Transcript_5319/g.8375  ORF Transcript_5319/g.8375 Transcript_5319/m.8375 type:complete len:84 (-) Transcript_5319:141-392(-)